MNYFRDYALACLLLYIYQTNHLSPESIMITSVIDFDRRRIPPDTTMPESAIELRFPRIARELAARWNGPDIDAYLDSLLIDTRGNRMGFPPDVLEEIMFLAGDPLVSEARMSIPETLESPRDEFSFCSDEFRRCGTSGAWVLV
jgi:hypothetical protein